MSNKFNMLFIVISIFEILFRWNVIIKMFIFEIFFKMMKKIMYIYIMFNLF